MGKNVTISLKEYKKLKLESDLCKIPTFLDISKENPWNKNMR